MFPVRACSGNHFTGRWIGLRRKHGVLVVPNLIDVIPSGEVVSKRKCTEHIEHMINLKEKNEASIILLCFNKCFVTYIVSMIGMFVKKSLMSKVKHLWLAFSFSVVMS